MGKVMDAEEFYQIQRRAGLSDSELARRLKYGPNGERRLRRFRAGKKAIPDNVAAFMRALIAES